MNKQEWLCQRVCESLNVPEKDLKDFVDIELGKVKRLVRKDESPETES